MSLILNVRRSALLGLALTAWLAAAGVQAQARFEEDFDDSSKTWQEITVQLPKVPDTSTSALLPFDVSATASQSFAVAAGTLSVGSDGVIRYVLVARSASGAENISYEGLRCASLEKKLYAFGRQDGSWSRSRRDLWEPISGNAANRQHAALAEDYFCDGHTVAGDATSILARLKSKTSRIRYFSR